jgi:hypothetical protein
VQFSYFVQILFCRLFCFKQNDPQQKTACHSRQAAAQKSARTLLQVRALVPEFSGPLPPARTVSGSASDLRYGDADQMNLCVSRVNQRVS